MLTVLLICVGILFLEKANSDLTGDTQDFAVRLNNSFGNNSRVGRLEIYYSGRWGTVCDDGFTNVTARVACASLGFGYIGAVIDNRYGPGEDPIWLDEVHCNGTESGIEQCVHNAWGVNDCSHGEDVSISCECDDMYFSGLNGQISSPNFPMEYYNNLDCSSYITVSSGQTIIITLLAFDTERGFDWLTITCESGNAFTSTHTGFEFPAVLAISSCNLVNVHLHTDISATGTGFSLTYDITPDTAVGGFTTKPSNAFSRSDTGDPVIFNCTTVTKHLPWWTINDKSFKNYGITNSNCQVITSAPYSYWFMTESLGPGSCNLIVVAPAKTLNLLAGSVICTDSTLASARVILAPINPELRFTTGTRSSAKVTDIVRDEKMRISCNPSFTDQYSGSSLVFTYFIYLGGPAVKIRIRRTSWTSEGRVVPSTKTSNASSYVMVNASVGVFPRYTCNIDCDFVSEISDISGDSSIEIPFSTDPIEVLYWPTEDNMTIIGDNNGQIQTPALLYCNVAANPPATYTWIDESNGNTTKGPTIMINHGGRYTCNASNIIRGNYYQQSKSINLQSILEDDTHQLQLPVIILGALLGAAVLSIIIISAILLSRKCRQPKRNTAADAGRINRCNEHELRQRGDRNNRYEDRFANAVDDYDKLHASQRPISNISNTYEELPDRK